jgi:hypothetical protein
MVNAIKESSEGRLVHKKIVHRFIKGHMLSSLDGLGDQIIEEDVLHGLRETKKNANTSIRDMTVGVTRTRR